MAAESATTETVEKKDESEVNLKENGDSQNAPETEEEEPRPAKKRDVNTEEEEGAEPAEGAEKSNLDDDQNVENPAYIPKTGRFYMHDDGRRVDVSAEHGAGGDDESRRSLKKSRADGDWKHDRFDEKFQRPKTKKQIVTKYGFDIRHKEGEEGPESTEEESSDARAVRQPQKDRRVSSGRGGKSGARRPMKQREREDTVDESEKNDEEEEARPAQKRQVKQQEKPPARKPKPAPSAAPAAPQSSEENGEDEEDEGAVRRGQRRTVPLRRGTASGPSRLRGRMTHQMAPPRRSSGSGNAPRESPARRSNGREEQNQPAASSRGPPSRGPPSRRDYSHVDRNDDRFENHRRGVIRGASRGSVSSSRGFSRGGSHTMRGSSRGGAPRYQGVRRTDTSEQSEGYQRGSGTDYSSPRPQHHQSPPIPSRGGSVPYPSSYPRGFVHAPSYPNRGGFSNAGAGHVEYVPRGGYHQGGPPPGPPQHKQQFVRGPPPGAMGPPPMVAVGVVPANVVPPPQMTRGAMHGGHGNLGGHGGHGGQQRIRQPTDVVYFDPQQQQGNRQLPPRSKKVIPIVDPNDQK